MTEQEKQEWSEAMEPLIAHDKEVQAHNAILLKDLDCDDLNEILQDVYVDDKIEWVDEPRFEPEKNPDVYGIFTLKYVDQRSVGMEGDSFYGFLYIKVDGYEKYLKVPYSC